MAVNTKRLPRNAWILVTTFAVALVVAGAAVAAVSFDPATGTGSVGKVDVQKAFSWKNSQLQQNAADVSFAYVSRTYYTLVCPEDTYSDVITVTQPILDEIATNPSGTQINGFTLTGYEPQPPRVITFACADGSPGVLTLPPSVADLVVTYGDISVPLGF
jgi:hypothetical protein